jgi:2-polyprenyl-3-methyl-5-hydroxy-6-metoxy-1,4-benzoquinol methylase
MPSMSENVSVTASRPKRLDLPATNCPLCQAAPGAVVSEIRLADVWTAYAQHHSTVFSDRVTARYGSGPVKLLRCGRCELDWFHPPLEGDGNFYAELCSSVSYEPWRWEFDLAARRIPPMARVVEVGAGEGAFLRSVLSRCESVEAIDKNPAAATSLRTAGITVIDTDVRIDALDRPGRADVVCAFQVLEHVADIRGFLTALAAIVIPGGEILVSVPNRDRLPAAGPGPKDYPPHHLSRWTARQLSIAADLLGLDFVGVRYQPPSVSHVRAPHARAVRRALAPVIGTIGADIVAWRTARIRMPEQRYRRLAERGDFVARGQYGHTIFAVLRRRTIPKPVLL